MICDVFNENERVVVNDDVHGQTTMSWQEALERCRIVLIAETQARARDQSLIARKWVPYMIRAAVKARQFAQPGWQPPASVLDVPITPKPSRILVPGMN